MDVAGSSPAGSAIMRLSIELIPATCWYTNVRSSVTKEQWNYIRKQVYTAAYDTCEICGGVGNEWPVECHEVWDYDDVNHVQKLERMIALCPDCHAVKHSGRSLFIDSEMDRVTNHFRKVNKIKNKYKAFNAHLVEAMIIWTERSQHEWILDISILSEYGIDVTKLKKKEKQ